MSTTEYDSKENVLKIVSSEKKENTEQLIEKAKQNSPQTLSTQDTSSVGEQSQKTEGRQLRGFVITYGNTQEEVDEYQQGRAQKLQLAPVLASNEQEAINFLRNQGKLPITILSYELLKAQLKLIEEIATEEKVKLVHLDIFNFQKN